MSKRVPKTMIFVEFSTTSDANVYKDRAKTGANNKFFVDFSTYSEPNVYKDRIKTHAKNHDFC